MRSLPAVQAPAVVCSGSNPLGVAIVRSLATAGHPVSFGGHSGDQVSFELEKELADAGLLGSAFELDISDASSLSRFGDLCTARFGPPLCVVVNPPITISAAHCFVEQFLADMRSREYGRVVLVGSAAGIVGLPGRSDLCADSAGLEGLARSLAVSLGTFDVLVNALAPGYVEELTDGLVPESHSKQVKASTALRRPAEAKEVAEAVRFLCSDDASAITGITLRVDGGLTA
ncbi:MAG: SDR family oxidoreductase [Acidimicrobiia bacterium]|nr:SDR family oxidoreductase [Acidimicrobiia bacterium]